MRSFFIAGLLAIALAVEDDLSLLQRSAVLSADDEGSAERIQAVDDGDEAEDDFDDEDDADMNAGGKKCVASKCYKNDGKKMKLSKCDTKKCGACPECPPPTPNPTPSPTDSPTPNPTPNPTVNPTPNPTPNPTANPTPSPTPPVLRSGDVVHVQNLYDGGSSWLDTCGGASCAGSTAYRVSTSTSSNRDGGSGLWQVTKVHGNGIINSGDSVYLVNQYSTPTYLDSCGGASCTSGTQWGVFTSRGSRGSTSQWAIEKYGSGPIGFGETVTFKNLYTGGNGYLDSCGSGNCGGSTKWNVYTNTGVRGSTSQWRLHATR